MPQVTIVARAMTKATAALMLTAFSSLSETPKKGHRPRKRMSRMLLTSMAPKKMTKSFTAPPG